jgi:hypothetical protein
LPTRLAFPFRGVGKTIRASLDDPGHALAEAVANVLEPRCAALIFGAVVQERRNSEVFVTAVLQNRRGHSQ